MENTSLIMCTDAIPSFLGIFNFSIAPTFLFYSYIPIAILAILIGVFVLIKDKFSVQSKFLFLISLSFLFYICNEILLWIAAPAATVYFGWSLLILFRLLIVICTIYFAFAFIYKKIPFSLNLIVTILTVPAILTLPTTLNVSGFDLGACEGINGPLWYYFYALEMSAVLLFLFLGFRAYLNYNRTKDAVVVQQSILAFACAFLVSIFSISTIWGNYTLTYEINLVGTVGMLIFIGILAYMIVRFKTFNIKLIGAQALVVTLWFLVGSLMFVAVSSTTRITAGVTLLFTTIAGYYLVKSVKKEVALREKIEELVVDLNKANERLKILDKMKSEFVSIASHQLRSPLTSIRGYASMLAEGSYGKLAPKAQEIVQNIADSSMLMAQSVEDYLNVSRIEAGNMKYEMSDFNLKDVTEKIVDEMRSVAMKKGLVLIFRSDCTSGCITHADIGKTRQVIMNLLDNSMKYTPKGTITVVAHDDIKSKKMYITLQDTGVGMSKETQEEVFDKFVRAKNANNINVTGTGLGLFVAKKMVEEMGGKVWAESEGEGKGSAFHIELPLASGI